MSQLTQPFSSRNAILALSLLHLRQRLLRLREQPALSTAVAMSRATAMTALINKTHVAPLCVFWNVPSKSTRAGICRGGGLPPENLAATVGDYNDAVAGKATPDRAPLCTQDQPRCARVKMRGWSRYLDNRMVRRGPMSCPNALPKPYAPRVSLVGRTLCSIAL